ncbi:MAG: hypothetical protein OXF62_06640 [Caldilineaceae bacterium]|nr:hypothetical protein [Caldilineaceae bacterium]MDE0429849.1 hypothetical protein [Caldilineaceae bacterium]
MADTLQGKGSLRAGRFRMRIAPVLSLPLPVSVMVFTWLGYAAQH